MTRERGGKGTRGDDVRKAVRSLRNAGKGGVHIKNLGRDEGLYIGKTKQDALATALVETRIAIRISRFFLRAAPPSDNDAASIAAAAEMYHALRSHHD